MSKKYITKNGLQKKMQQLKELDLQAFELQKRIGEVVSIDNDLRENPEYLALQLRATHEIPRQKRKLQESITDVVIIENEPEFIHFDGTKVIIGSRLTLLFDGEEEQYTILGNDEGDIDSDVISCDSDLARALLGHSLHETVVFRGISIVIQKIEKFE